MFQVNLPLPDLSPFLNWPCQRIEHRSETFLNSETEVVTQVHRSMTLREMRKMNLTVSYILSALSTSFTRLASIATASRLEAIAFEFF